MFCSGDQDGRCRPVGEGRAPSCAVRRKDQCDHCAVRQTAAGARGGGAGRGRGRLRRQRKPGADSGGWNGVGLGPSLAGAPRLRSQGPRCPRDFQCRGDGLGTRPSERLPGSQGPHLPVSARPASQCAVTPDLRLGTSPGGLWACQHYRRRRPALQAHLAQR